MHLTFWDFEQGCWGASPFYFLCLSLSSAACSPSTQLFNVNFPTTLSLCTCMCGSPISSAFRETRKSGWSRLSNPGRLLSAVAPNEVLPLAWRELQLCQIRSNLDPLAFAHVWWWAFSSSDIWSHQNIILASEHLAGFMLHNVKETYAHTWRIIARLSRSLLRQRYLTTNQH